MLSTFTVTDVLSG